ncbi:hypothetical protein [Tenacibaculum geojense]|uniref:Uncharacterized protein n=1 Tax=Tenacibaculum geojense TaxID=915352 RepID=A0ABW3JRK9_9FLAO
MLRPITPFVEYAINYDYIAKVLCINKDKPEMQCNGKCQLMQKLEQQQEDDFNSLRISIEEYPIGFITLLSVDTNHDFYYTDKKEEFSYSNMYSFLKENSVFHPPTV